MSSAKYVFHSVYLRERGPLTPIAFQTIIYIPAYLKDLGKLRSATHFLGIGALLAVLCQLTFSTY